MERPPLTTAKGNLSSSMSGQSSWHGLVSDVLPYSFKAKFKYKIKDIIVSLLWEVITKGSIVLRHNPSLLLQQPE